MVSCVGWAPNGDWIVSCSNKDFTGRVWDVTAPEKKKNNVKLTNNMICLLKKHTMQITKIQFHTDLLLVSSSQEHSIVLWEISKISRAGQMQYKGRAIRKIANTKFYQEIIITKERFICRKGNPGGEIKIIKFTDMK